MSKFFKTQHPLINVLFLNYYTSKILIFTFFANMPKMPKDIKNKNKGQI